MARRTAQALAVVAVASGALSGCASVGEVGIGRRPTAATPPSAQVEAPTNPAPKAEPAPKAPRTAKAAAVDLASTEDLQLLALESQTLSPNACGLFLWSRVRPPNFVFFYEGVERGALVNLNGREVSLLRTSVDGREFFRQFETQTFASADGAVSASLTLEPGRQLVDGMVVPQGALKVKNEAGWEIIAPVGGLIACESE